MKDDNLLEIFSVLSKAIIVIPIIIVIAALFFRFNKKHQPTLDYLYKPSPTITPKPTVISSPIKLDLKGPFICSGKIEEASASAFIKDKKIKIILQNKKETENILIAGDCFYKWDEGEYTGRRVCGLSPLISMVETLAGFGGLNFDLLFDQLNSFNVDNKIATDQAKINELVKSCKKENIKEEIFEVPAGVLFKNNPL